MTTDHVTSKVRIIRRITAYVFGGGFISTIAAYFILPGVSEVLSLREYIHQDVRFFTLAAITAVLLTLVFITRRSQVLYSILWGVALLSALATIIYAFSFALSTWDKKQILEQRSESSGATEDSLEVSAVKIRDVVEENIATLAELDDLRTQVAAGAGAAQGAQVITETIIQTGEGLNISCANGEILLFDGVWSCAAFEDVYEDSEIEGVETIVSAPSGLLGGNTIATYENEVGDVFDINETVTTLTRNANGSFTHRSENEVSRRLSPRLRLEQIQVKSFIQMKMALQQ